MAAIRRTLFLLFFFSGFSSLIYQVVWTRMAFASFGIITPVLSVVLSVFMLGLAAGSQAGGVLIGWLVGRSQRSAARYYAMAEFLIGVGAFAVPLLFNLCHRLLLPTGEMDSLTYLLLSALALAISIFPWCFFMGTTFPFMMAYVRELEPGNTKSFSFLYVANVLGAMAGTFLTAFALIEMFGFHGTLDVAAAGNFLIAIISAYLAHKRGMPADSIAEKTSGQPAALMNSISTALTSTFVKLILFSTGFISMSMEVVWSRAFTVVLKTQVYSFAAIVFVYLAATFVGSLVYRWQLRRNRIASLVTLLGLVAIAALLPVIVNDVRFIQQDTDYRHNWRSVSFILGSIFPFCALLGYLTPRLIDDYSAGSPRKAGEAYAINVLGCILGPLVAAYLLLPWLNQSLALVILSIPLAIFWLAVARSQSFPWRAATALAGVVALVWSLFFSLDFEQAWLRYSPQTQVRRDYVASVISCVGPQYDKELLVNGFGMTTLTPITKFMAHIPIAMHKERPKSILVICFGMGTTYRSCLSWDIDTTVVELVPSVVQAFPYYHSDARLYMNHPHGHIVIDDGRRYLSRCDKKFDIIIVDPPPPIQAAGSSLLFSTDFYTLAKEHLNPDGIIQMWDPNRTERPTAAILRSMYESFPYVRCYGPIQGLGIHMLGSMQPLPKMTPKEMIARMPLLAQADLLEWSGGEDPVSYATRVLGQEIPFFRYHNPEIEVTDDQPFNEYFILRQLRGMDAAITAAAP